MCYPMSGRWPRLSNVPRVFSDVSCMRWQRLQVAECIVYGVHVGLEQGSKTPSAVRDRVSVLATRGAPHTVSAVSQCTRQCAWCQYTMGSEDIR